MNAITRHLKTSLCRALIAGAASVALAAGVRAGESGKVHVSYADLNVNGHAGAAVLFRRIRAAADRVCGADGTRELARRTLEDACITRATAEAVATVNNPSLTRLYEAAVGVNPALQLASLH